MTAFLKSRHHETELAEIVRIRASQPITIIFVDDIAKWAAKNLIAVEGNPVATSVPKVHGVAPRIVLRESIDENDFLGAIGRLEFRSEWELGSRMRKDPKIFLIHLVLHELAHIENGWPQDREDDCDAWATARLP